MTSFNVKVSEVLFSSDAVKYFLSVSADWDK